MSFFGRGTARAHLAAAQHCGAVTERPDLVELVADVEHAAAFGRDGAKHAEQALDRLG